MSKITPEKLKELQDTVVEAEEIARQLVADKHHGTSHFVAGIRSNLSCAMELIAEHKNWSDKNPAPAEKETAAA